MSFLRLQRLVHLIGRYAVGQQRPLHDDARIAPQAAFAGKALQVEEVRELRRALIAKAFVVIGDNGRPNRLAHAAFRQSAGNEILGRRRTVVPGGQYAVVDFLEQAFAAAADQIGQLEVDHVPDHVGGLDLLTDLL